ncbi:hypothetical protein [Niallia sp. Krafla_26]|uniref:hypothetical protein n=1 Tax=Niallia sp. Krafla_26 TaxID=3064703 RepID=UPI003D1800D5
MKDKWNTLYIFIIGVISIYTQELVTFLMLGFILIALNNIHRTLKEILKVKKNESKTE